MVLTAAVAALMVGPVCDAAPLTLSVAAPRVHYSALERLDSGEVANSESGLLSGFNVSLGATPMAAAATGGPRDPGCGEGDSPCGWQWLGTAERLTGVVAYNGRTQGGLPLRTRSTIGRDDLALAAWRSMAVAGPWQGRLVLRLGQRRVDRAIAPTLRSAALGEVLRWRYLQLGADARWPLGGGWAALAGARLEQGLWARLDVDFHGWADAMKLNPTRGHLGHAVALGLAHDAAGGWGLRLEWRRERQQAGASAWQTAWYAGQAVSRMRYPGSIQVADGVEIRVSVTWR